MVTPNGAMHAVGSPDECYDHLCSAGMFNLTGSIFTPSIQTSRLALCLCSWMSFTSKCRLMRRCARYSYSSRESTCFSLTTWYPAPQVTTIFHPPIGNYVWRDFSCDVMSASQHHSEYDRPFYWNEPKGVSRNGIQMEERRRYIALCQQ